MSNVSLEIGGRQYSVASADGEEEHVAQLGRRIDEKLRAMGGAGGQSESRMLLFAALLLADELHEGGPARAAAVPSAAADDYADRLEAIAARLETCASHLEG